MSTLSSSFMVRYGGASLAVVAARVSRKPSTIQPACLRENSARRRRAETDGRVGPAAQAVQRPSSALIAAPQDGQTAVADAPLAPLRLAFQAASFCANRCAVVLCPAV